MRVNGLVILFVVLGLLSGCSSSNSVDPSHTLNISGAWAIYPLAVKWKDAYAKLHPGVTINISAGGAGKGLTDVLCGSVEIGMVSREIDQAEIEKGAYPVFIARDGVFPTISANNPAAKTLISKGITQETLAELYIEGRQLKWSRVADGPDSPVRIYTRSDACGAAAAWASSLGEYNQDQLKGTGVYGDPGLLQAVRQDPLAIGYNNLGYLFKENQVVEGVLIVPIDTNRNGKADTEEQVEDQEKACRLIMSGEYPGARREFFVTKGKPTGLARQFIEFALSDEGTKILNEVGGYVPVPKEHRHIAN